ncbi:MAG: helix-turn-helix transcriptional regulator, partial [Firmicutes bacterium]|nr:helix-turn-helix transcriptional regulator [Bacillota bacterium]
CDLAEVLGMSQSAVSHQLRVLRGLNLVRNRREGKEVFYSLDDEHVMNMLAQAADHVRHTLGSSR